MSKFPKRRNSAVSRNILMMLFLMALSWIFWLHLQKRSLINRENMAIEHIEAGKPTAAVIILLRLRQNFHKDKDLQRIDGHLADCYQQLAEVPENSAEVSMRYYRRLFRIAPERVPENVRKRIQRENEEN